VAALSPRIALLVARFGVSRLIVAGMTLMIGAYALFLPIGLHSGHASAMLPTFVIAGLGFGLAFGPLNIAATNGVAPHEQGLAGGLLNTSFQFGGALFLAITTAAYNANARSGHSAQALLDGLHPALAVPVIAAGLGLVAVSVRRNVRQVEADEPVDAFDFEAEPEAEAA
jgi:MFS family permease